MAPTMRLRRQATPPPKTNHIPKARSARKHTSYIEPASDPEFDDDDYSRTPFSPAPPTPPRSSRKRVVYTEPGDDPMEGFSQGAVEHFSSPVSPGTTYAELESTNQSIKKEIKRKRKAASTPQRSTRSKRPKLRQFGADKGKGKAKEPVMKKKEYDIHLTGKAMLWSTLPYHILEMIFDYASRPLINEDFSPTFNVVWLTQMARTCKACAEPALSVLYASPPLSPPNRVRELVERLEAQNVASSMNYRAKIKYLDFEARDILGRKSDSLDPFDLARLLRITPQLRGIGTHLLSDNPKWYQLYAHKRVANVAYPEYMPDMLSNAEFKLQEWIWNANMVRLESYHKLLRETHPLPAFQTIRNLTFVNYDDISRDNGDGDGGKEYTRDVLPMSLQALPSLRSLSFKSSPILETMPLARLPNNLTSLELVDCGVEAASLGFFLQSKGDHLTKLVLNHNRRLNLAWLNHLAVACPKLEALTMDLIFYSAYATVSDTEPQFRALLSPSDLPTWPRSLQRLELYHLRKWQTSVARTFFDSLVSAASDLADLREIRIKASLDESGWRERIAFRDKWTQRLRHVFLRSSPPPNPHFKSILAFKAWKRQERPTNRKESKSLVEIKLQSVQVPVTNPRAAEVVGESDSDAPLASKSNIRRSRRAKTPKDYNETSSSKSSLKSSFPNDSQRRRRRRRRRNPNDSSDEDSALEDDTVTLMPRRLSTKTPGGRSLSISAAGMNNDKEGTDGEEEMVVQGMCDVVDVMIDNLRPTEEQLHESDFLDEELSGDEDWNGEDGWEDEGGYAW
ncbi:uncharacterized protein KY384_000125 [Bacidia gigantensis]|uniref:uncharacterized protein n=1 Tax=Bacidia gigantensis TaxID=2732470 RepID=UPI001D05B89D|nr:uncharacterized protein KY384_000125 [Bacidia gigantensis]KAG8526132.1 hypothetical protein KY384_000125 [Bacidia gigantensis]